MSDFINTSSMLPLVGTNVYGKYITPGFGEHMVELIYHGNGKWVEVFGGNLGPQPDQWRLIEEEDDV